MRGKYAWAWALSAMLLTGCGGGGGGGGGGGESPAPPAPPPVPPAPPVISAQPLAATVDDGASAQFSVTATGVGALRYQWSRNDQVIAGATGASYTTPILTLADHGQNYKVSVSNDGGTVSSNAVLLSVRPVAPGIGTQPVAVTVADGERVGFAVQAKGSAPLTYQWLRNGQPVADATQASLSLDPATLTDHGAMFSVRVRNAAGEVTSQTAQLTVNPVPAALVSKPEAVTVKDGELASFRATAKGSAPLSYQWLLDGQAIAGATAASYTLTAGYAANGRRYSVKVSNPWGSVTSEPALLTVTALAPSVTQAPRELTLQVGQSARFTVSAGGTGPLRYQWERSLDAGTSWQPIAQATSTEYELNQPTLALHDVRLRVVVSNVAGSVASSPVSLRVQAANRLVTGLQGGQGFANGVGSAVRFNMPGPAVADSRGHVFVPDQWNHVIRRIAPDGTVSTFLGQAGQAGFEDGVGERARLFYPRALAIDAQDNLYVIEQYRVRRVTPQGDVRTFVGSIDGAHRDGSGEQARFRNLSALSIDADGNLAVLDGFYNSFTLRTISKAGVVRTLAGDPVASAASPVDGRGDQVRFANPLALTWGLQGELYVAEWNAVRKAMPDGTVSLHAGSYDQSWQDRDDLLLRARFAGVIGLGADASGRLYVLTSSGLVRRIELDGNVYTLAGAGSFPETDGPAASARFGSVSGFNVTRDGSRLLISSNYSHAVREMRINGGMVRTLAGSLLGDGGSRPGDPGESRIGSNGVMSLDASGRVLLATMDYTYPVLRLTDDNRLVDEGLRAYPLMGCPGAAARDAAGNVYVLDRCYRQVLRVTPTGEQSTYAGSREQFMSDAPLVDGPRLDARFGSLQAIAVAPDGTVYVADSSHNTIRRISTSGMVSTLAGRPGECLHRDGIASEARLCGPTALALDPQGRLLIADRNTHTIRRIEADGRVVTVAGTPNAAGLSNGMVGRFSLPNGVSSDADGNIYVSDEDNAAVRRISPNGFVTTVMGNGMQAVQLNVPGGGINKPRGVLVRPNGRLLVITEQALISD